MSDREILDRAADLLQARADELRRQYRRDRNVVTHAQHTQYVAGAILCRSYALTLDDDELPF